MDTTAFGGWESFYVLVGSAASALTGLTFVVIALLRDVHRVQPQGVRSFVTPTIVHFSSVLLLAGFLTMPHAALAPVRWVIGAGGLLGAGYSLRVAFQLRSQTYQPVWEDWLWNAVVPTLAYAALAVLAALLGSHARPAAYGIGVVCLTLLVAGIHNAWDLAVWTTLAQSRRES